MPQMLDAFEIVRARSSREVHLILAGGLSERTRQRIPSLGSAWELGFVGPDLLPALYGSSDIAVTPSSWESFGFTVLEGMASQVATIAGAHGGMPEQIVDGESTHLPEAGARLAEAILRVTEDDAFRHRLADGGRKRSLDVFSERRLGDDLMNVFRS